MPVTQARAAGASPAAARSAAQAFRPATGQKVEVEAYGTQVTAAVVRAGNGTVVVDGPRIHLLTRLRLGVRVTATFGIPDGGAARVEATLGSSRDGIALQFCGPVQLVNRRASARAAISVPVDLIWVSRGGSAATTSSATTLDLSTGGIRLQAGPGSTLPEEGTLVLVALRLPQGPMTLPARVLAVSGTTVRAQFCGPHSDDVAVIDALVVQALAGGAA